jgi:hypothetical protein
MRDAGSAVARHPDTLTIYAAVQLAAATILLREGVGLTNSSGIVLFDHLIRPLQERRRDRQAEGFRGLEVDSEVYLGRALDRQISRTRST